MFASRIPFSQLSKNDSSPPSEKKQFYIIPDPVVPEDNFQILKVQNNDKHTILVWASSGKETGSDNQDPRSFS